MTLAGNDAFDHDDFTGGDVVAVEGGAAVTFNNSIIAENGGPAEDCDPATYTTGTYSSTGGLLVDNPTSGCPANVIGNPVLRPLADNGGPTQTRSPAGNAGIDIGNPATCSVEDQRQVARPQGAGCDAGAFERTVAPTVSAITGPNPTLAGAPRSYTVTATHPQSQPLEYSWSVAGASPTIVGGSTASPQITFGAAGTAFVRVNVRPAGSSAAEGVDRLLTVKVGPEDDLPPVVTLATGSTTFPEGSTVTTSFTVNDPEFHSVSWSPGYPQCGTGGTLVSSSLTATAGSVNCHYPEGDVFPLVRTQGAGRVRRRGRGGHARLLGARRAADDHHHRRHDSG